MLIQKEDLRTALEIVKPGLASKEIIEQSTSFAFMDDKVVTYNDEISISHPVEGLSLTGAIKAEELYQLLNKLKKDEIEVTLTENEVILKAGKVKAGIRLQKEISLPVEEIGNIGKWKKLPDKFVEGLKFVLPSVSNNMSKPILTCVHMDENKVEASDGFQICQFIMLDMMPVEELLIPASSIRELIKLEPTKIAKGQGWVHFKTETGAVISCRVFEDNFPDVNAHLKVEGVELVLPKNMPEMLELVSIFSKRDVFIDENIVIEIENNRLKIKGESDSGWLTEKARIKYEGEKIIFNITPSLLRNILSQSVECILGKEKIKFAGEDWEFIAMLRYDKNKTAPAPTKKEDTEDESLSEDDIPF